MKSLRRFFKACIGQAELLYAKVEKKSSLICVYVRECVCACERASVY